MFVIFFSSSSGVILNPFFSEHLTIFGVPPAKRTISGYETQYGAGIITSSPGFTVAKIALKIICFPPVPTEICSNK